MVEDKKDISLAASGAFMEIVRQRRGKAVFLLPTGATPEGMYKILAEKLKASPIDLKGVIAFHLDEYENGVDYFDFVYRRNLIGRLKLLGVESSRWPTVYIIRGIDYKDVKEIE